MTGKDIIVFTLDANDIRICESSNSVENRDNRTKALNTKFKSCITPDFMPEKIIPLILEKKPEMLLFITSNESTFQSYFHTEMLINSLRETGYSLLKSTSLAKRDATSLNMSLYVRSRDRDNYTNRQKFRYEIPQETFNYRRYGSVGIRFKVVVNGKVTSYCFVGVSLPDDTDDHILSVAKKTTYIASIEKNIIRDRKGHPPDFFIMAGNFGYLLDSDRDLTGLSIKELLAEDYITQEKKNRKSIFYKFKEGVDDAGPNFFPPYGSKIGRNTERCDTAKTFVEYRANCINSSDLNVGWNSRILYGSVYYPEEIKCTMYGKVEYGEIRKMNNVGIISHITLE